MLGHKLVQRLSGRFDVWTTVRGRPCTYARYGLIEEARVVGGVDVLNWDSIEDVMSRVRPDALVNCVGIIKQLPSAHDPVLSLSINALLPHRLQRLCVAAGARLLHVSTDCVFSGRKGAYTEDDTSDAIDMYGRTKYLGETSGEGALTVRTSVIGRELATTSGLVEWLLSQRGRRVHGYRHAIYTGFTTERMAEITAFLLRDRPELHGTIQVSSDPISKYDLLHLLREAFGVDLEIEPADDVQIDRSLDSSRFRTMTGFVPVSWPDMVRELAADPTPYDLWRADATA